MPLWVNLHVSMLILKCIMCVYSKRTVSEVQLMHNLGEQKQVQDRRDWLQMRLRGVHTAPARGTSSGEVGRPRKRLRPEELPDLGDLTAEEIQNALKLFERILKAKQT